MDVGAGEGAVVELDKDDESAKLADVKLGVLAGEQGVGSHRFHHASHGGAGSGKLGLEVLLDRVEIGEVGRGTCHLVAGDVRRCHQLAVGELGIHIISRGRLHHGISILGGGVVHELVAEEADGKIGTIGLKHLCRRGVGRDSVGNNIAHDIG